MENFIPQFEVVKKLLIWPGQLKLEVYAVIYMVMFMTLAALSFATNPSIRVFAVFSEDLGIYLTPQLFTGLSVAGATVSLLLLLPGVRLWGPYHKRLLYIASGLPLAAYTVPSAWYLYKTGGSGLGLVTFFMLYFGFAVIAAAVYRDK